MSIVLCCLRGRQPARAKSVRVLARRLRPRLSEQLDAIWYALELSAHATPKLLGIVHLRTHIPADVRANSLPERK